MRTRFQIYWAGAVVACIAIVDVARDTMAMADGGEEAGDIVADTRFGLQGFADIGILIKAVVVILVSEILGHPHVCPKHHLFIGCPSGNLVEEIFVLSAPQYAGTVCQRNTEF